jgi:hypothetical protein
MSHPNITLYNGWEMSVEALSPKDIESDLEGPFVLTRINGRQPHRYRLLRSTKHDTCLLISETNPRRFLTDLWVRIRPDGTLDPLLPTTHHFR